MWSSKAERSSPEKAEPQADAPEGEDVSAQEMNEAAEGNEESPAAAASEAPEPDADGDATDEPDASALPPRRRRIVTLAAVAAGVYLLDVISKIIVVATMSDRGPIHLVDGALVLHLDRNAGAAFSIGVNMTIVFTAVAVIVAVVIIRTARELYSGPWAVALGMLLGGALGNLTDRIFRQPGVFRGQVVDFIELPHWPIFNFADSGIVLGGCLMVLLTFRGIQHDGTLHRDREEHSHSE